MKKILLLVTITAIFALFVTGCASVDTTVQNETSDVESNDTSAIQTPKICTMEYAPVCGVDGVTYGNKCMAGDTEIDYVGECTSVEEETTPICTREYRPVCGVDNMTYSNQCMAGSVEIAYEGEC